MMENRKRAIYQNAQFHSAQGIIQAKIVSDAYEITRIQKGAKFENGYTTNIFFRGVSRGTLPNFPVIAEFLHRDDEPFDIEIVLHRTAQDCYEPIPMEIR